MQDVIAQRLGGAVTGNQRIRKQRDRAAAPVLHFVPDREQIMIVDRDGAAEQKALAVVISECYRAIDTETAVALLGPQRVRPGHFLRRPGGRNPAELRVVGLGCAGGREQHDRRRFRIDGFAVLLERQIVDAGALKSDAAVEPGRFDGHALRCSDHGLAGVRLRRLGGSSRPAWHCRGAGRRPGRRRIERPVGARLDLHLFLLLLLEHRVVALLLHLRIADEVLPSDHDNERQHDGEDGVLVFKHSALSRREFGRLDVRSGDRRSRLFPGAPPRQRPGRRTRLM